MKTLACAFAFCMICGLAAAIELNPGSYYWYVPEHEKYARTAFYMQPNFQSAQVRVTRTQRFRLVGAKKGWAQIEFDASGRAYVHLRLLRSIGHDPKAVDPHYEFKRASLFTEEPAKVEARLFVPASPTAEAAPDSKVPAWKRYKEGWNIKSGRTSKLPPPSDGTPVDPYARPTQPGLEKKPRTRIPMEQPADAEPPPAEGTGSDASGSGTTAERPAP